MDFPLHLIPLIPLVCSAVNLLVGRRLSREASSQLAVVAVAASFLVAASAFLKMTRGDVATPLHENWYTWIPAGSLTVTASFLMDPLSAVMTLIVTGVGLLIHVYSIGYMSEERDYARYFGYLNLFTGSMLVLVLGDNLLASFVGWEGVGVCSYLLIGFWYDKDANASAGRKAFITNRIGDFGFLLGIFLLATYIGSLSYGDLELKHAALRTPLWGKTVAFWAGILLFVGATGKSAQIPLYVWLPDAMAGPTPVSALIHAATMVTAGVYMVVRLHFLYAAALQVMGAIMVVGTATAVWAALMALAQTDIKKVLAYSTISQLGFMFVGAAGATPHAGIFHLMTHAFFKAGLFLGAGSVMHALGGRGDILQMGGLGKKTRITHATFLVFCLAIAGCPPLAGFFSKDAILGSAMGLDLQIPVWRPFGTVIAIVLVGCAGLTSFYMFRLYFLVFSGSSRAEPDVYAHAHESPAVMTVPLCVLAVLTVLGGLVGLPRHDLLGEFLGATPEEHIPWLNMLLGTAAFGGGLALAAAFYAGGVRAPARRLVAALPLAHRILVNKFYVDELYDWLFIRPLRAIARGSALVIDRVLIDGLLVGGVARVVAAVGYLARRVQNGDVQRYLAVLVIGAAVMVWRASRVPSPQIRINAVDANRLSVTSLTFPTPGAKRRWRYCWRIDGGPCAATSEQAELDLPAGRHRLTLYILDSDWGTSASSSVEVHGS
jgi:NADH-quinone oxidoreductase subunit L